MGYSDGGAKEVTGGRNSLTNVDFDINIDKLSNFLAFNIRISVFFRN
jgi:hypothetical protein